MPKIAALGGLSSRGFGEFAQQTAANYIEDVFSTYLYTGNSSSNTIVNGIDLSTKGGLVWIKSRTDTTYGGHAFYDTARGFQYLLSSSGDGSGNAAAQSTSPQYNTNSGSDNFRSFNVNGFTLGPDSWYYKNNSGNTYASWTFRKQPKFFDVATGTVDVNGNIIINHSLGVSPGFVILKDYSAAQNWWVWHRSYGANDQYQFLNTTAAQATLGSPNTWVINATQVGIQNPSAGPGGGPFTPGDSYVAYVFAHNAGGFGVDGSQNVISCGSYVGNGSATGPVVELGWEPQWVMVKQATATSVSANMAWNMYDIMRGQGVDQSNYLRANSAIAEVTDYNDCCVFQTGFNIKTGSANYNESGKTYIYMAIRRGPMRTPTSGTSVFNPQIYTGDYNTTTPITGMNPATDMWWNANRASSSYYSMDRLRGWNYIYTASTSAENTSVTWTTQTQTSMLPSSSWWGSSANQINYFLNRAPGFFDVVCWTGNSSTSRAIPHNLQTAPEMMIVKGRTDNGNNNWFVYHSGLNNGTNPQQYSVNLNLTDAQTFDTGYILWANTVPTSSNFYVGDAWSNNKSGNTYVGYLFATCPGVSKVGSYTGTGATQTISCGFTGGARFVLIKRTDTTGSWYVWDTARGMVAGTDPYLLTNVGAAEVNTNSVYTTTGGFQIVSTAADINASGGSYIYLAIA